MWIRFVLIFISIFYIALTKTQSCDQTEKLTFEPCDDGLSWPIEDFSSITVLITHGIHCIDIIQKNGSLPLHQEHCMDLMRQMLKFFEASPDYTVPTELCRDFQDVAFPGGRIRRGAWESWKATWVNGRPPRSVVYDSIGAQTLEFKTMATENFEKLLLKEKKGVKLSRPETAYLEEARSPQSIRIAALGIYCKYEGYVGVVKDTIEQGPRF